MSRIELIGYLFFEMSIDEQRSCLNFGNSNSTMQSVTEHSTLIHCPGPRIHIKRWIDRV
ncbi:hypothetical protein LguiA_005188 [Lonicera macranthoides]